MLLYRLIAKENILYVPIASREFTTVESQKVCFDQKYARWSSNILVCWLYFDTFLVARAMKERIKKLQKEKDVAILAQYYVDGDVQEIAD